MMERDLSTFAWEDPRLQHLGSIQYLHAGRRAEDPKFFLGGMASGPDMSKPLHHQPKNSLAPAFCAKR